MKLFVNIQKKLLGFELDVRFETENNILGILGSSGAGKSMTLRCIAGLENPDCGKIVLDDRTLFDSGKGIHVSSQKRKVGFVFQSFALFPHLTVEQNIGFGLDTGAKEKRIPKIQGMIQMMQLEGLEKRFPYQLSGGQQQRVALARALAVEPDVLLLDEPFSALDEHLRDQMVDQLTEILENYHGFTLFVTHNIEEAYRICDRLAILSNGKMEALGTKDEIFKNPPSLEAARITGCSNISRARWVSNNIVEAIDWGCILTTENVNAGIEHVGIRDHYISLAESVSKVNVFNCWPVSIRETPFRVNVYLNIGRPPSGRRNYQLQWDISKEEWYRLKDMPKPWRVQLNQDKLIYLYR